MKASVLKWLGVPVTLSDGDFWAAYYGTDASGKPINIDAALQVSTVWACVRLISQAISTLPLFLYRRDGGPESKRRQVARNHPLFPLIHSLPNKNSTAVIFWEAIVASLLLRGAAYVEMRVIRGVLRGLIFLDLDRVELRLSRAPGTTGSATSTAPCATSAAIASGSFPGSIAKKVMQVHWVDHEIGEIGKRAIKRSQLMAFVGRRPGARIVLEACGRSPLRQLGSLGNEVRLLHARHVRLLWSGRRRDEVRPVTHPQAAAPPLRTSRGCAGCRPRAKSSRRCCASDRHGRPSITSAYSGSGRRIPALGWPCFAGGAQACKRQ
jgi:hypothetical protein